MVIKISRLAECQSVKCGLKTDSKSVPEGRGLRHISGKIFPKTERKSLILKEWISAQTAVYFYSRFAPNLMIQKGNWRSLVRLRP